MKVKDLIDKIKSQKFKTDDKISLMIDKVCEETYEDKGEGYPLRPSAALHCKRALWYELQNRVTPNSYQKREVEGRMVRTFEIGKRLEDYLSGIVEVKNQQKEVEIVSAMNPSFSIKGSIDGTIGDKIIDFKTISSTGFKFIPNPQNVAQIVLYLHSKWAVDNGFKQGLLIYFNKENSMLKTIVVDSDPLLAETILTRFQKIKESEKILPRDFILDQTYQCGYCPYRDECYKNIKPLDEMMKECKGFKKLTKEEWVVMSKLDKEEKMKYSLNLWESQKMGYTIDGRKGYLPARWISKLELKEVLINV